MTFHEYYTALHELASLWEAETASPTSWITLYEFMQWASERAKKEAQEPPGEAIGAELIPEDMLRGDLGSTESHKLRPPGAEPGPASNSEQIPPGVDTGRAVGVGPISSAFLRVPSENLGDLTGTEFGDKLAAWSEKHKTASQKKCETLLSEIALYTTVQQCDRLEKNKKVALEMEIEDQLIVSRVVASRRNEIRLDQEKWRAQRKLFDKEVK